MGRTPSTSEQAMLLSWLEQARSLHAQDRASAEKLAGSNALAAAKNQAEAAAWVELARILFNADEFITRP